MVKKILFVFYALFLSGSDTLAQTDHLNHIYLDANASISILENTFTRS